MVSVVVGGEGSVHVFLDDLAGSADGAHSFTARANSVLHNLVRLDPARDKLDILVRDRDLVSAAVQMASVCPADKNHSFRFRNFRGNGISVGDRDTALVLQGRKLARVLGHIRRFNRRSVGDLDFLRRDDTEHQIVLVFIRSGIIGHTCRSGAVYNRIRRPVVVIVSDRRLAQLQISLAPCVGVLIDVIGLVVIVRDGVIE